MLDNAKNFAKVTVSTGYDASATSIVLSSGHGSKLPTVPFNAVWWNTTDYNDPSDDPNVEIVRVTAISTDTLTVTRGQESISATTKNTASKTYKMIAGLTALGANTVLTNSNVAITGSTPLTLTQDVATSGSPNLVSITGGAHTTLTASTEATDILLNLARTVQFATGALTAQRAVYIKAPTYAFVGASTITTAATFAVSGPPVAGTNATLTKTYSILSEDGNVCFTMASAAALVVDFLGNNAANNARTVTFKSAVAATSSGADFTLASTGVTRTAGALLNIVNNATTRFSVAFNGALSITQSAGTTGSPAIMTLTGGAHTTLTASGSFTDVSWALARTVQMATGAVTFAKIVNITAPTLAFVGASTVTDAATVYISGAPTAGTNATITSPYALYCASGIIAFGGDVRFLQQSTEFLVYGTQTSTTYLIFRGNQSTTGTGSDVRIGTSATRTAGYILQISNVNTVAVQWDFTGAQHTIQIAGATGSLWTQKIVAGAHTNQTLSTEAPEIIWDLSAVKQFATGALTTQRSIKISAPTYAFVGASTLSTAATFYIDKAPVAGTNATITDKYALWIDADSARFDGRVLEAKGADVASASTLTLGSDGNTFAITGTTTINYITTAGWTAGACFTLLFSTSVTLTHNAGSVPGGTFALLLSGAANFSATANDSITFIHDGANWREIGRTVI